MTRTIAIGASGMGWIGAVHRRSYGQIVDRFPDTGLCPSLNTSPTEIAPQ